MNTTKLEVSFSAASPNYRSQAFMGFYFALNLHTFPPTLTQENQKWPLCVIWHVVLSPKQTESRHSESSPSTPARHGACVNTSQTMIPTTDQEVPDQKRHSSVAFQDMVPIKPGVTFFPLSWGHRWFLHPNLEPTGMRETSLSQLTIPHLFNSFLSKTLETGYDRCYFNYKLIVLSFSVLWSAKAMDPYYPFSID